MSGEEQFGPLEALLMQIALAVRSARPIVHDNDNGPTEYVLPSRDWMRIRELALAVRTPLLRHGPDDEAVVYAPVSESGG